MRYQEILRRLAIVDEGFAGGQAGLVLDPPGGRSLDPRTAALVRVGVLAATRAPEACLEWGSSRALAAGATEEEITAVLLATAPVISLGRITAAAATWLVAGLVVFAGLAAVQVRATIAAPFPGLRAIEALATSIPLLLALFAATSFVMARLSPGR